MKTWTKINQQNIFLEGHFKTIGKWVQKRQTLIFTVANPPRHRACEASGRVEGSLIKPIPIQSSRGGIYASPLTPSTAPARSPVGGVAALAGLPNHYKTNEKSTFRNLALQGTIMPAKTISRPSQEAPKRLQDRLKRPQ